MKISQIGKRDDDEVGCLVDIDSEAARKMFRTMPTTLAGVTALVFGPKRLTKARWGVPLRPLLGKPIQHIAKFHNKRPECADGGKSDKNTLKTP